MSHFKSPITFDAGSASACLNLAWGTYQGAGDTVTATVLPGRPGEIVIESISQDGGRLSKEPAENCAGIAALETLKLLGPIACGVSLALVKVNLYFADNSVCTFH